MIADDFDSRPPRRWLKRLVIWTLVLAIVLSGGWTWFSLNWPYSEGERAGVLQKFSRKGWLCKTYEGELALYIVSGVAPQIWHFSTRDPKLAGELTKNVGRTCGCATPSTGAYRPTALPRRRISRKVLR